MKNKTILLTGGSGVIGSLLLQKLINQYKLIAIGTDYSRIDETIRHHKNFKFYERDFTKLQHSKELNIPETIDIIIHLAGVVSGSKISESAYFQINSESTKFLIEFALSKKCTALALASSVSVYGVHSAKLTISSPRNGSTIYARSKIKAEHLLEKSMLSHSIFRIASVYGHGTKSFVSKLLSLYRKGFYPRVSHEQRKSIVHVEDVVNAISSWTSKVANSQPILPVYVISHPESVTIDEVIREFRLQKKARFNGFAIPILRFYVPIFNWIYKILRRIRHQPDHDSPLAPILNSIEIFDESSWKDLAISPKWDLRKGISQYK